MHACREQMPLCLGRHACEAAEGEVRLLRAGQHMPSHGDLAEKQGCEEAIFLKVPEFPCFFFSSSPFLFYFVFFNQKVLVVVMISDELPNGELKKATR